MAHIVIIENNPLSDEKINEYGKLISPNRVIKLNKYVKYDDKTRSLHAALLTRCLISKIFHLPNNQIVINTTKYGKPYVDLPYLYFNISHSGDFICCIIDNHNVGVDIEQIRFYDENVADRFYTKSEIELINCNPTDTKEMIFYQIWTAKEAYLKYLGTGLHKKLNSFTVNISNRNHISIIDPENSTSNLITNIIPFNNYFIASVSLTDTTYDFWDNDTYRQNIKFYLG